MEKGQKPGLQSDATPQKMAMLKAQPEEDVPTELRGGLHGRYSRSFCVLQAEVDALQSFLTDHVNPFVMDTVEPMLAEMQHRISYLERLTAATADMALGCAGQLTRPLYPMEMVGYLQMLVSCVNEEMVLRGKPNFVQLLSGATGQNLCWTKADSGLVDGLILNLISNSLRACQSHATVRLTVEPGKLLYQDNGPGLSQQSARLLEQGVWNETAAQNGELGLAVAHQYAAALRWNLLVENADSVNTGLKLEIQLPALPATGRAELRSSLGEARGRRSVCLSHVRRELDGLDTQW